MADDRATFIPLSVGAAKPRTLACQKGRSSSRSTPEISYHRCLICKLGLITLHYFEQSLMYSSDLSNRFHSEPQVVSPVSNNLLLQKLLTGLIRSWIKLFVICLYCTPDTYLSKVLISAPLHLSTSQSVMESIFFIIVLEIVFFSIYRWGTEAERVNDFPAVLTRILRRRKDLALAWLCVRLRQQPPGRETSASWGEGGKGVLTKCIILVIYQTYIQFRKLPCSKGMREAQNIIFAFFICFGSYNIHNYIIYKSF